MAETVTQQCNGCTGEKRLGARYMIRSIPLLSALTAGLLLSACGETKSSAPVGSWQADMGNIRVAVRNDEADPDNVARWTGYREHLKDITGLDVETFEASDYNGVIQAISSGQVDIATMGGGSYANVDAQVGSKVRPFLTIRQAEGGLGYYSALIVKADSSYRTLDELKGKSIAYVDFNSTSGYIFPRDTLLKQGYDPEKHFAKAIMAGGASQALLAVVNGRVDAAMTTVSAGTPETGFAAGSHITLARSGMINAGDVRIIWTAGPIANSPYVIRTDRPQAFQDVIRGAFAMLPYEKPQVWDDMGQALGNDFAPVSRDNYTDIIAIRDREIKARRKGGGGK